MNLAIWQIILGLTAAVLGSSVLAVMVKGWLDKQKTDEETAGLSLRNKKDSVEFDDILEEKIQKKIDENLEQREKILTLTNELGFERRMRKEQGETLNLVQQDIGGIKESEKNCRERQTQLESEIRQIRERNEVRDEERHRETMTMFQKLFDVLAERITLKTN